MNRATIDALSKASNLELFHLSLILQRLMSDPARILPLRMKLHVGQHVRFVDVRVADPEMRMRSGRIIAMKDVEATIQDGKTLWTVPYAAIEMPDVDSSDASVSEPPAPKMGRENFHLGERVCFEDRYLRTQVGRIVRLNKKTASLICEDGLEWRVGYALLRPMIDV